MFIYYPIIHDKGCKRKFEISLLADHMVAKHADNYEMLHNAASHLGLHGLLMSSHLGLHSLLMSYLKIARQ